MACNARGFAELYRSRYFTLSSYGKVSNKKYNDSMQ